LETHRVRDQKRVFARLSLCEGLLSKDNLVSRARLIVVDLADAGSPKENRENIGTERFELRIFPILEGGDIPGTFAVFHVARTDVDPEEDVPLPGPETNDNVETNSWQGERKGKTYSGGRVVAR
jgi:hypothetical protein